MKRIILSVLFAAIAASGYAQTTAAAYNFTALAGTYASISGTGTSTTAISVDDATINVPLGFNFVFCGTTYTTISACSNGWAKLGSTTSTVFTNSTANIVGAGMLIPYWDDLWGTGGTAYYQTSGTAPNRIFTFEWSNWGSLAGSGTANFQLMLYESTNIIEFWYGNSTYSGHTATSGIANSTTDWQTIPDVSASPTPSSTTFTTTLATSPANGQIYRWYGCAVTASATNSGAICAGGTVTLTGTTSGTTYSWAGPGGYSTTALNPVLTSPAAGIYTLSASNGSCTTTATTTVSYLAAAPVPTVTPSSATICNGNSVSLTAVVPATPGTILSQDWNSGIAPWTVDNTGMTSTSPLGPWQIQPSGYIYAGFLTVSSPDGTQYVMTNADAGGSGSVTASKITSPVFSLAGYSSASLSFQIFYNRWALGDVNVNAEISTDGGTTWNVINNYFTAGASVGTSTAFATATWPLTAYLGSANCRIRFNYQTTWGFYWALDNVVITGTPTSTTPPTWSPTTDLFTDPAFTTPYIAGTPAATVYVHPTSISTTTTVNYIATVTGSTCNSYDTGVVTIIPGVAPITGNTNLCAGTSTTLSNATGLGTWSTSNTTVATINPTTGVVYALSGGIDTVYYTLPGGCSAYAVITVSYLSPATTGNTIVCNGGFTSLLSNATGGGSWSSSNLAVATVTGGLVTSGIAGSAIITYSLPNGCFDTTLFTSAPTPAAITGTPNVCYNGGTTNLADATPGGTWTSSNATVADVTSAGLVTGYTSGAATISYTTYPGCFATLSLNMLSNPAAITGGTEVCEGGSTITLANATPSGSWGVTPLSTATISGSGIVSGITAGNATVTYTATNGCYVTRVITVNPLPSVIAGTMSVCQTAVTTLSSTPGGTWTSGATTIATVNGASGAVYGVLGGVAPITYTLTTGCKRTANVTVNTIPGPITGNSYVCNGYTTSLADAVSGGTWSTNLPSRATVSASGVVYGVSVGAFTVTYTTGTSGCFVTKPMVVSPVGPPTVTVSPSTGATVCAGTTVTFDPTIVGGGTSPLYVWSVNNVILSGASSYTYVPSNGDVVRLWIISNYECAVPDTASNTVTMTVNPIVTPSLSLSTGMGDTVCTPGITTITPTAVNGGTAPVYQWLLNGVPSGSGPFYVYAPTNGDVITCHLTSNAPCATTPNATATKTLTVSPYVTPYVTLNSMLGLVTCDGYPDVFTTAQINGGTNPTYQWFVNGVSSGTGNNFTYVPTNGDVVQVTMTSNFPCLATPTASANVSLTVLPITQPVGVITAVPGYIVAPGMYDTFTCNIISGGGLAPLYQWYVNSVPVSGATSNVYITNVLHNGDSVSCEVTNTDQCSGISVFGNMHIIVSSNVGVQHTSILKDAVALVPNPNNGTFRVQGTLNSMSNGTVDLQVTDMLGKVISTSSAQVTNGWLDEQLKLDEGVANGVYLLTLRVAGESSTIHFSLQR